jgi:hypothetical protein
MGGSHLPNSVQMLTDHNFQQLEASRDRAAPIGRNMLVYVECIISQVPTAQGRELPLAVTSFIF